MSQLEEEKKIRKEVTLNYEVYENQKQALRDLEEAARKVDMLQKQDRKELENLLERFTKQAMFIYDTGGAVSVWASGKGSLVLEAKEKEWPRKKVFTTQMKYEPEVGRCKDCVFFRHALSGDASFCNAEGRLGMPMEPEDGCEKFSRKENKCN